VTIDPFTILILFILADVLPSTIASIILHFAKIDISSWTTDDREIFILYPLYPVFARYWESTASRLNTIAWTVFFFPFFEETLFFAVPSMYGFLYALISGIAWSLVHITRLLSWMVKSGYSTLQIIAGLFAGILVYIPHAVVSAYLWSVGLGVVSIFYHSTHNLLAYIGTIRAESIEKKTLRVGKYYKVRQRRYFKIKSWEE